MQYSKGEIKDFIKDLVSSGYSRYSSVNGYAEYMYAKSFKNNKNNILYQIIINFYDYSKFEQFENDIKCMSLEYKMMLSSNLIDRVDLNLSDQSNRLNIGMFEKLSENFYDFSVENNLI